MKEEVWFESTTSTMRLFTEKELENERWKPMFGYEEYCEASTLGRIKVLQRFIKTKDDKIKNMKEKILNLGYYSNGYEQFSISINNKRHTGIVHRFIAKTFLINPNNLNTINHKNGIRDDNRVCNLEWCSQSDNMKHSFRKLKRKIKNMSGENNNNSILKEEDILKIRKLHNESNYSQRKIAKLYSVQPSCINKIIKKETWKQIKIN